MALENLPSQPSLAPTSIDSPQEINLPADHTSQPIRAMGQNGSSPVGDGGDGSSRASSPPLGEDETYDGLPRLDANAASDFQVSYSQPVEGLPTTFSPTTRTAQPALAFTNEGTSSNDLAAISSNMASGPKSPESAKSKKKKKRRRSKDKTHGPEQSPDQATHTLVTAAVIEEVSATPEAEVAMIATTETVDEPTAASPDTRRKKKKSKTDKANGSRLDLNEDPIAGSDEEAVIPSSDKRSHRRKSHHDDDGSSRKFKKKHSIPTVTEMDVSAIEDVANEEPRADIVESTQTGPHNTVDAAATNFLQRASASQLYEIGEEHSSPLVTRKERRARFAPVMSAPASLTEVVGAEHAQHQSPHALLPSQIKNGESDARQPAPSGEAMDVYAIDPRLQSNPARAASKDDMGPGSDYSGDLPNYGEDTVMNEDTDLPRVHQTSGTDTAHPPPADLGEDDALMAVTSTRPEPATDDEPDVSEPLIDEDEETRRFNMLATANGDESEPHGPSTGSAISIQGLPKRGANAKAAAKDNRTRPDINNLLVATGEKTSTATQPNATQTSAHATPRSTRTYTRHPKPSFLDRGEQETAEAFAELPTNDVAATPKPTKGKTKRRLPVDDADAEAGPSSKRQKSETAKALKASKDPNAPRKAPGRKKAPETALRSSTGFLTGVFTKTEVSQVERAVEAFRSDHDLPQVEVNAIIQQNPKDPNIKDNSLHEELWARIMEACPTRPRQKLLNWSRQKFHNFVARATWTPEQDAELVEAIKQHGTKWNVIGQLINRHQKDVRDRYRNYLIAGDNRRNNTWSADEEKEFLDIVGEVLSIFQDERRRNPDSDMFRSGKTNEELVDWNVVAERMRHGRTRLQCQEKWRRMREGNKINETVLATLVEPDQRWRLKRARHEIATMSHADMYHIVLAIPALDYRAKEDRLINWKAILESQRKKYHRYTGMLLWSRLRQLVSDQENKDVQQVAKELIAMYQSDGGTFAMPGDDAFDREEEEKLLADIPPPRKRGPGKPKAGKGKDQAQRRASSRSKEFVDDSGSDEEEEVDERDSSRADPSENSPAPDVASTEQSQARADDEVSVDLSNDAGQGDRGGSVDLGIDPSIYDYDDMPTSGKPRQASKSKSKGSKGSKEKEAASLPTSPAKKHKKRFSGEMTGFTPQKPGAVADDSVGRKRARADVADDAPNGAAEVSRKSKRAKRASAPVEQAAPSSDDEMEDIPARLPVAEM